MSPTGPQQVAIQIVPGEASAVPRTYANFCAATRTPFDLTLTFCELEPLSEEEVRAAAAKGVATAPVRARIVIPVALVSTLVKTLQEHAQTATVGGEQQSVKTMH